MKSCNRNIRKVVLGVVVVLCGLSLEGDVFVKAQTGNCFADGGWVEGDPVACVFPFEYIFSDGSKLTVNSCEETWDLEKYMGNVLNPATPTNPQTNTELWCATSSTYTVEKTKDLVRKNWGYCLCPTSAPTTSSGPGNGGSPTPPPSPEGTLPPGTTAAPTVPTTDNNNNDDNNNGEDGKNNNHNDVHQGSVFGDFTQELEDNQVVILTILAIAYVVAVLIALLALFKCGRQSMKYPLDDISASNVAARLTYHYDRAGVLGGCLSSGMGWREAAILLMGSGKLPKMLFASRVFVTLCCLAVISLSLSATKCEECFVRYLIASYGFVGFAWGGINMVINLTPLKVLGGTKQQSLQRLEAKISATLNVATLLTIDFVIFIMGTTTGFAGLVIGFPDGLLLSAAILAVLCAIISLGPCLAVHTLWMGYDLNSLTPPMEHLVAEVETQQQQGNGSRRSPRGENGQPLDKEDSPTNRRSYRVGSAKYAVPPTLEATATVDRAGRRVSITRNSRRKSVAQKMLAVEGPWGITDIVMRLLCSCLCVVTITLAFMMSPNSPCLVLGIASVLVLVLQTIRIVLDARTLYNNTYRRDPEPHIMEFDEDDPVKAVTLTWKNTIVGRILWFIEGALILAIVMGICIISSAAGTHLTTSLAGYFVLLSLAATFIFSYIACFGYAGGELHIPKNRISALIRNSTLMHPEQGYVFPVVLQNHHHHHHHQQQQAERKSSAKEIDIENPFPDARGPQNQAESELSDKFMQMSPVNNNNGQQGTSGIASLVRKHSSNTLENAANLVRKHSSNTLKAIKSAFGGSGSGDENDDNNNTGDTQGDYQNENELEGHVDELDESNITEEDSDEDDEDLELVAVI